MLHPRRYTTEEALDIITAIDEDDSGDEYSVDIMDDVAITANTDGDGDNSDEYDSNAEEIVGNSDGSNQGHLFPSKVENISWTKTNVERRGPIASVMYFLKNCTIKLL